MLKEKIQMDLILALKGNRKLELSVLRMLLTAISNKETEKRTKNWKQKPETLPKDLEKESQLADEEIFGVISSEIKKRNEALLLFQKGKREDLAGKEKKEIKILERYLPKQLTEEGIKKLAKEVIEKIGAKEIKDMAKVMAELMPKLKGRAGGSLVSKIVKELLVTKE